ncbi:MAG: Response regulator receiver domain [Pseudomonadota bacterium]
MKVWGTLLCINEFHHTGGARYKTGSSRVDAKHSVETESLAHGIMKEQTLKMSPAERAACTILVVESDSADANFMREALKSLGFIGISDAPSHHVALEKLTTRQFTHVIFDAKKNPSYPMKDWLTKVLDFDSSIIAVPTSLNPNIDDVFDLLIIGARGYLVKPFTFESIDAAIVMATKGEPISDRVLGAKDRNEALVAMMMTSVDRLATVFRQSKQFETAQRALPHAVAALARAADLAHTFAKGGEEGLIASLENFCIKQSQGPATRLGRLRKRLSTSRTADETSPE